MKRLDGITSSLDVSLSELRKMVLDREAWHAAIHGVAKSQTLNWTELNWTLLVHKSQSYERLHSTWSFRKEWKLVKWSSTCFRFYNHLFKLIFSFMYFSLKNSVSECPVTDSLPYLLHSTLYYYFHSLYTLYANRSNMKIDCYWVNFIEYKLVSS